MSNKSNLEKAREMLINSEYTCVVCSDDLTLTSELRGVAPLLKFLDEGKDLCNSSAADKVVGNGAAFLYVLLKIKELYAGVISNAALDTLEKNGISVTYSELVPAIKNRSGTGFCPIETAVKGISDPNEALAAIKSKLSEMKRGK